MVKKVAKKVLKKKKYVFRINSQVRKGDQEILRNDIIKLLRVSGIEFSLDTKEKESKHCIGRMKFTFETMEEARLFAIKILETGVIFLCSLSEE